MLNILKLLAFFICVTLFSFILVAQEQEKKEEKTQNLEVAGVLEKGPANLGAAKAPKMYQIKTADKEIISLPSFIEGKQVEFERFLNKKVIAKGKGTIEIKKNDKGEEIKSTIFSQLDSLELADAKAKPSPNNAKELPKVLIIGDSISLGYTEPVKKSLNGIADVSRPGENCQHSGNGVIKIKSWIGTTKWDVIHFNFGIWDTHLLDAKGNIVHPDPASGDVHVRYTPEQYKENLTEIVKILKGTGAKLIWASTTPIMCRTGARFETISNYNKIAASIMKENGIEIDDLYNYVIKDVKEWQSTDQVHYTPAGYLEIAKQVTASIEKTLKIKK